MADFIDYKQASQTIPVTLRLKESDSSSELITYIEPSEIVGLEASCPESMAYRNIAAVDCRVSGSGEERENQFRIVAVLFCLLQRSGDKIVNARY